MVFINNSESEMGYFFALSRSFISAIAWESLEIMGELRKLINLYVKLEKNPKKFIENVCAIV